MLLRVVKFVGPPNTFCPGSLTNATVLCADPGGTSICVPPRKKHQLVVTASVQEGGESAREQGLCYAVICAADPVNTTLRAFRTIIYPNKWCVLDLSASRPLLPCTPPAPRSSLFPWKRQPQIRFLLLQNRQGKTRLSKWWIPLHDEKEKVIRISDLDGYRVARARFSRRRRAILSARGAWRVGLPSCPRGTRFKGNTMCVLGYRTYSLGSVPQHWQ